MKIENILVLIIAMFLFGCYEPSKCSLCQVEDYDKNQNDTLIQLETYLDSIHLLSGALQVRNSKYEAYRISSKSAFGSSLNSYLFECRENGYFISFQEIWEDHKNENPMKIINETEFEIDELEWQHIQYLICNFGFWTETQIKTVEALDGGIMILEGNCPAVKSPNKSFSRIVYRGTPQRQDRISRLFDQLTIVYEHLEPY